MYTTRAVLYKPFLPISVTFENLGWLGRMCIFFGRIHQVLGLPGAEMVKRGCWCVACFGQIHKVPGPFCPPSLILGSHGSWCIRCFVSVPGLTWPDTRSWYVPCSLLAHMHRVSAPSITFSRLVRLLSFLVLGHRRLIEKMAQCIGFD